MTTGIFMKDGDNLIELVEVSYDSEAILQELLSKYPSLMYGGLGEFENKSGLILVKAEAKVSADSDTTSNWWIDHLFLDRSGVPTIVEVKRSSDTRLRREVIGQILEYAANAMTQWSADTLRILMENNSSTADGENSSNALEEFLKPDVDIEEFWQSVQTNLQAGRMRLLLVADQIPRETRRIIEFLNEQMSPSEILAIEIKQFSTSDDHSNSMFIPKVFGQTVQTQAKKSGGGPKRQWDKESFLNEIGSKDPTASTVARRLIDECQARKVRDWWGTGARSGSYFPMIDGPDNWYAMFALWTSGSAGVELQFQHLMNKPPFNDIDMRIHLQELLNKIPNVHIPDNKLTLRPSFSMRELADPESMELFLKAFDWFIAQVPT